MEFYEDRDPSLQALPEPILSVWLAMFHRDNAKGGDIFHWAILGTVDDSKTGTLCHASRPTSESTNWFYETKPCDTARSRCLVALFQVGAWEASDTKELETMLAEVPIRYSVNEPHLPWACNVWAADALRLLNEKGTYIYTHSHGVRHKLN